MSAFASLTKKEFISPDYRRAYAEGYLGSRLALQITILRQQRGMTQEDLAKAAGTTTKTIRSYETDGNERWDIPTLQKIAAALDVWLKISFEGFETLWREANNLTIGELRRPTFEQGCKPKWQYEEGPRGEMRRKLFPWLSARSWNFAPLVEWLQGYDLPAVSDEVTPAQWLLDAVDGYPQRRAKLTRRVLTALGDLPALGNLGKPERREDIESNIRRLAQELTAIPKKKI